MGCGSLPGTGIPIAWYPVPFPGGTGRTKVLGSVDYGRSTAVVEWEVFVAVNKTWPEWKAFFIEAYEVREASGITAGGVGYHSAANA